MSEVITFEILECHETPVSEDTLAINLLRGPKH